MTESLPKSLANELMMNSTQVTKLAYLPKTTFIFVESQNLVHLIAATTK